jgi:hypothetical protein
MAYNLLQFKTAFELNQTSKYARLYFVSNKIDVTDELEIRNLIADQSNKYVVFVEDSEHYPIYTDIPKDYLNDKNKITLYNSDGKPDEYIYDGDKVYSLQLDNTNKVLVKSTKNDYTILVVLLVAFTIKVLYFDQPITF